MEDAKFMSAQEKEKVLKQFEKFLDRLDRKAFTKQLYEHLHLHCGFIAHYDINGFYNTYFNGDKDDFKQFCENFLNDEDTPLGSNAWCQDMVDINTAMAEVLAKHYQRLLMSATESTRQSAIMEIRRLMTNNNLSIIDLED